MSENPFLIVAHRGASGYELENSYAAFNKAVELGAAMVETDVQETKDGILILMHDATINRTTLAEGKIEDLTIEQIRNIKLKNNENIPILGEVLGKLGDKIRFNLDIKAESIEKKVYNLLVKYKLIEKTIISSFSFAVLKNFYAIDPNLNLAFITYLPWTLLRLKYSFQKLKANGIRIINPISKFVSKSFVEKAHAHDFKIYPWTIDERNTVLKFRDTYKVDGVITNFPDILREKKP